jgi:hypothetical protein
LANRYAEAMPMSTAVKMELLGELDPLKRLEKVARTVLDSPSE